MHARIQISYLSNFITLPYLKSGFWIAPGYILIMKLFGLFIFIENANANLLPIGSLSRIPVSSVASCKTVNFY